MYAKSNVENNLKLAFSLAATKSSGMHPTIPSSPSFTKVARIKQVPPYCLINQISIGPFHNYTGRCTDISNTRFKQKITLSPQVSSSAHISRPSNVVKRRVHQQSNLQCIKTNKPVVGVLTIGYVNGKLIINYKFR